MRGFLGIVLAVCSGLVLAGAPPAQHFFEPAYYKDAALSPSGRYIAMRMGDSTMRDRLVVFDVEKLSVIGGAKLSRYDIDDVRWVNDKRLVFTVVDHQVAPGDRRHAPGLYGIDRDGKALRQLAEHTVHTAMTTGTLIRSRLEPWNTYLMPQDGAQDSDTIYVRRPIWEDSSYALLQTNLVKLDTVTGQSSSVTRPVQPQAWLLDHKGQPTIITSEQAGKESIHFRNADGEWRELATFDAYGKGQNGISPLGFYDDKRLLVKTRMNGDKSALHLLDLSTGKIDPQALVTMEDFDFSGSMIYSNKRLVGIRYVADARATAWFEPGLKAAQQEIDKLMPGTINLITPPTAPETPWLLVVSYADRQPRMYTLYNATTHELKGFGSSRPEIKPAEMGRQQFVKYTARDGMAIPAWITLPAKGARNLPLVVLVHGGPYLRGNEWGWDADAQFLASRGYAVLEPEFRGSTGYGARLFEAGLKQWGLKMQDDIADGVKWAVDKGFADGNRVCLVGGSYGGYATLMGLIKDPAVYRCGVAYAAVTDIPLLFSSGSVSVLSDLPDDYRRYGAPVLVGDVDKDAAQLEATSPLKQAGRLKRPLLLAHGSDDRRVPAPHFAKMRKALQDANADAEFVEYDGEGHGWSLLSTRLDFWGRVEKFLDKHIGAGAKAE